ncbi:MAG: FAD-dependent oxidoreductase [Ilumatobacteraceae bacterium]|nr:FAD-dependent oxidoreductase [Ilumatobacteraceae bacterium]
MADQYDLVVVGGGPGGYAAAFYGASAGLNVALVEKDTIGGTCLNRGCIPAKAFLETAAARRHAEHAADFGIDVTVGATDFVVAQARKQKIVDGLVKGLTGLVKVKKVTYLLGVGALNADNSVTVTAEDGTVTQVKGDAVILAAGSVPRVIPGFEPGLANVVVRSFQKKKIDIKTGVAVKGHTPTGSGSTVLSFGEGETLEVDAVIVSVGRRPFADQLGLGNTKVAVSDRGFVEVDEYCATSVVGVYAIGDLINTPQLAHVAYAEAILVVQQLLGENAIPVDYDRVPWAIYCSPEVAWAGPGEEAAKAAGYDVVVAKHQFRANSRAMILGEIDGLVKIIAKKNPDGSAGQVLGVHMVGPWVTEQLSGGYLAVNWEATVDEIAHFIQPHPSLSELFGETVMSLTGRSINS